MTQRLRATFFVIVGGVSLAYIVRLCYNSMDVKCLRGQITPFTIWNSIADLAARTGARLMIMPGGDWFHMEEQMAFLDRWITGSERAERSRNGSQE